MGSVYHLSKPVVNTNKYFLQNNLQRYPQGNAYFLLTKTLTRASRVQSEPEFDENLSMYSSLCVKDAYKKTRFQNQWFMGRPPTQYM